MKSIYLTGALFLSEFARAVSAETLAPVTDYVYFDVQIDGEEYGRIVFGLFGATVPLTVKNFIDLSNGSNGIGELGYPLNYEGSPFHRLIPGFMA